nr:glycosyltransferase [uncultured Macellibacteroides sp.]
MEQLLIFSDLEIGLIGILVLLFLVQIGYYAGIYAKPLRTAKRLRLLVDDQQKKNFPPVSVIVYAKNESENLKRNLPSLLSQNYPDYEVIVINDGSTDESDEVLKILENDNKHLYHTYIPENVKYLSRKKLALTVGIKAAKHDILLFTEANCFPQSENWVASMAGKFSEGVDLVIGFCAYEDKRGFFHKLAAYDNLMIGIQYIASALIRHPFMGYGRNLAYRRQLFFDHKGYYKSLNLHAGDDDLFVNEAATPQNTRVVFSPDSITRMIAIDQFKVWKEMKVSRAATQKFYHGFSLTFYRIESVSRILFLGTAIIGICWSFIGNPLVAAVAGITWLTRLGVQLSVLHRLSAMLSQKPVTLWIPILEIIQPICSLYVRFYRIFRGKNDYTFRMQR